MKTTREIVCERLQLLKTPQTYANLARDLYCSESTLKRELVKLHKEGLVKRIQGFQGVVYWTWNR